MPVTLLSPPETRRRFEQDLATGLATLTIEEDGGRQRLEESGIELWSKTLRAFAIHPDDPLSAAARITARWGLRQGDWQVETEMRSVVTADDSAFHVHNELDAFEGGVRAYSRSWDFAVPRGPL
jgi:hypothetical protein